MSENGFARYGYKDAQGKFIPKDIRAQDVIATTGVTAEEHITNTDIHLAPGQAAAITGAVQSTLIGQPGGVVPLDAGGQIPAQYVSVDLLENAKIVGDYAAMLALTAKQAPLKSSVLVQDATGDATVGDGWALYWRVGTAGSTAVDWLKLAEGEGLDIDFSDFIRDDEKGAAGGVATLGGDGKVPDTQLPDAAFALDAAFCTDETDMASKNLRAGAIVLMAVENGAAGE